MISKRIVRNSIITTFISGFILLYFLFLIQTYIIPNNYQISIVILIGFAIIVIVLFYFLLKINSPNYIIASVKIINENLIKTILMVLMGITIFVPAVPFSDIIVAWNHVPILNYFRGVVFLIGVLFLPGACIFNLILPKSTIHKKLNVEPFLVKLTIYPIISLTFIGSLVLILNFLGFTRPSFIPFLFFSITFLYILSNFLQKNNKYELKNKITKIKISRYTLLILTIGLGLIIIALGFLLSSHHYLIAGDRWRAISSASLIGTGDFGLSQDTYTKYWGCVSFGLSVLCGIPYINTNVLLFLFIYLSITSVYLLIKILLKNMNEKLCVLSSIIIAILFNPHLLIFQFSYHSFVFFSLFISLTLFFIVIKSDHLENRQKLTTENKILLILSSLFLIQSFILYFIPALMGIGIIFLYGLFSANIKQYLRVFLIFYLLFILSFIIIDLFAFNFFSFWCLQFLSGFSGIPFNFFQIKPYSLRITYTSLFFYTLLLSTLFLLCIVYKFSSRLSIIINKIKLKINFVLEKKLKYLFVFSSIFFSICLLIADVDLYSLIFYLNASNLHLSFLSFYLNTLITSLRFFGILGIYLSFFGYKENKNQFFFLFSWIVLIIGLASSLIFLRWIQYPTFLISNIPEDYTYYMRYWFSRTWYYSMIPLSIFYSIGLVKVIQKLKSRSWRYYSYKKINSVVSLSLVALLIFLSLSTPITSVIYWENSYAVTDEEAQLISWTSTNIPRDSKILITSWQFKGRLEKDLYLYKTYYLDEVMNNTDYTIEDLMGNLTLQNILYFILEKQYECKYLELIDYFYTIRLYDEGGFLVMEKKSI